jgi:TldD protein
VALASSDVFAAVEFLKSEAPDFLRRFLKRRHAVYAELRFEATFHLSAEAEAGAVRRIVQGENAGFGLDVWCAREGGIVGRGQYGAIVGPLAGRPARLLAALRVGFEEAYQRAAADTIERKRRLKLYGPGAHSLIDQARIEHAGARAEFPAAFRIDPRSVDGKTVQELARHASRSVAGLDKSIAFNSIAAFTELRHELFVNSQGAMLSQAFAFSQGDCYVVARLGDGVQEIYDTIGQQRGLECLLEGQADGPMPNPDLVSFATLLANEARELAAAPVLKPPTGEVAVVTDPHFNALLVHEIIGHPCEADRALKREAAYAGRSWFLRSLQDHAVGQTVGSRFLSACSDPSLPAYGHYRYDAEGTLGRRAIHIERGVFREFLHSRTTAALLGVEPNGSVRATEAWFVPLIRMSNTFFMPGEQDPQNLIGEVDRGFYVCGHMIPSIAESRENFRISARRIYEIEHGRLGRLYRAGSVIADSKQFFLNLDGVGNDLRLFAIPNCGKGQPMQVKRMSNGGPTLRSRAYLTGSHQRT